jgi:hypothetical protein
VLATRLAALALLLLAALVIAVSLPSGSQAATRRAATSSKTPKQPTSLAASANLWATVNICDTAAHPETIGIRASMPGSGRKTERMYMRFQLQYFNQQEKRWHSIGASGDSGFVPLGSAQKRSPREYGRNFTVRPPSTGAFYLRGAVTFEWRRGSVVVRRVRERTTSNHKGTAGADPKGYSASKCVLAAGK